MSRRSRTEAGAGGGRSVVSSGLCGDYVSNTICRYVGSRRYLAEWSACEYDDIMDISLVGNKSESTYNTHLPGLNHMN